MKVIDCFMFFNEIELLDLRLRVLADVVDHHVLVEADRSFTGKPKPMVFGTVRDMFQEFSDKITCVPVTDLPIATPEDPWAAEEFQRNCIFRGLRQIGIEKGDRVIVSDVDEIPSPDAIRRHLHREEWTLFRQKLFYYYTNLKLKRAWGGSVMAPVGTFRTPQQLRRFAMRNQFSGARNGGWHYSYLAGYDPLRILNKVQNIVHGFHYHGGVEDVEISLSSLEDLWSKTRRRPSLTESSLVDSVEEGPPGMVDFVRKYPYLEYQAGKNCAILN